MSSWEIQSLIDETEAELTATRARLESRESELREVRDAIVSLESQLNAARNEGWHEKRSIEALIATNQSNRPEITGVPEWARPGLVDIASSFNEAERFAHSEMARLESALSAGTNESTALSASLGNLFGPHAMTRPAATNETAVIPLGEVRILKYIDGTVLAESPGNVDGLSLLLNSAYEYEVGSKIGAVPYRVFTISKPNWLDDNQTPERLGLNVTASMLAAEGRRAIVVLGGPAKPDIVSLDAQGKLWLTEVKGTYKGTPLSQAGLLRIVSEPKTEESITDPLTGKMKLWENSAEWLRRSGADVLRNLKAMSDSTSDSSTQAALHELTLRYAQSVASGFDPAGYSTEVFQVGASPAGERLPYLDPSLTLHAYCAEVTPERIMQVEIDTSSNGE